MAAGMLESLAVPSPRPLSRSSFATMATMGPFSSTLASRKPGFLSGFKGLAITNYNSRRSLMRARNRRTSGCGAIVCERPASTTEVPDVTKATWQSLVLDSDTPVLVVFWATWCGPCRMIHPVISKISKDYEGKLKCFKLNTDENPDITTQYGIRSIPTMILFKNGEKKDTVIGAVQESTLVTCIGRFL
ncbi:Protein-disulfide reductase protein [Dioscorea alata]|uniref:Protein-disulfide reductase protein n=1 Tax=Dioscorea alata TaxID=55571 RepID=A0ACB7WRQ4_DIOAL|nr:Protein-disulfide reductase protein [Dioscorea alata]